MDRRRGTSGRPGSSMEPVGTPQQTSLDESGYPNPAPSPAPSHSHSAPVQPTPQTADSNTAASMVDPLAVEAELASLKHRFLKGDMNAFGPDSSRIFAMMDHIHNEQDRLVRDHIEREIRNKPSWTNDGGTAGSGSDGHASSFTRFEDDERSMRSLMDRLGEIRDEITTLHKDKLMKLD